MTSASAPAMPALDRIVAAANRIVPVATAMRRGALGILLSEAFLAIIVVDRLDRHGVSGGWLIVAGVATAIPLLILAAFWVVLGEVVKLPKRLGDLPRDAYGHGLELWELAEQARKAKAINQYTLPIRVWRFARLIASTRELLTPWAPLLPLLNVQFLAAVAISSLAWIVELPLALLLT